MAWTVEELNALKSAYAQGVLSVRWGDKSVQYDTGEQLKARIAELERELGVRPTGLRTRIIVVDPGY
jgi:hypothetical protein